MLFNKRPQLQHKYFSYRKKIDNRNKWKNCVIPAGVKLSLVLDV